MGREKRQISENGIYHVYFCGINKQNIFIDDNDREFFISILEKNSSVFTLLSYCIMNSSVNLLIKESEYGYISKGMQKLLTSYASYFNRKYKRSGSLFENRYKSVPVKDDDVADVINLIHKLPKNYKTYKWSSYTSLISGDGICKNIYNINFEEIHTNSPDNGLNPANPKLLKDKILNEKLMSLLGDISPSEISKLSKKERDDTLFMLRENGFTIGQLMRLTGISRSIVTRSNKPKQQTNSKKQDMQVFLL